MIPKLFIRLVIILLSSLGTGFLVNQWYSRGIPWTLLKPRWENQSANSTILFISADSALGYYHRETAQFIDTRSEEEYNIDHIPGAQLLSLEQYYRNPGILDNLNKNRLYIFYCFDPECPEAESLAKEFATRRFSSVMVLYGGFAAWLENGYPVEQ